MNFCASCSLSFHKAPSEGVDGCDCLKAGCGCRMKREGWRFIAAGQNAPQFEHPWDNA